jgi:hypothetical protein
MSEEEINKTIAEYMGWKFADIIDGHANLWKCGDDIFISRHFTQSLDALVPVIEKLDKEIWLQFKRHNVKNYHLIAVGTKENVHFETAGNFKDASLALAIACAKVIKELKVSDE